MIIILDISSRNFKHWREQRRTYKHWSNHKKSVLAEIVLEEESNNWKEILTLPITVGQTVYLQSDECASMTLECSQDNTILESIAEQSSCHLETNDEQGEHISNTIIANSVNSDNEILLTDITTEKSTKHTEYEGIENRTMRTYWQAQQQQN